MVVVSTWDSYFRQEDGPRSHPIVDKGLRSPADEAFDTINYTKGENVLRMLSYYVGEGKFRAGLKRYLNDHGYNNATYQDLFSAIESESGKSLIKFRDSWLTQRGYPVLSYDGEWDGKKSSYQLSLTQVRLESCSGRGAVYGSRFRSFFTEGRRHPTPLESRSR